MVLTLAFLRLLYRTISTAQRWSQMSKTSPKLSPQNVARTALNEFCEAYRVSRDTAYKLMRSGKLKYFSVGTERRISVEAAEALARA